VGFSATLVVMWQLPLGADRRGSAYCEGLGVSEDLVLKDACLYMSTGRSNYPGARIKHAPSMHSAAKNTNIAARSRVMQPQSLLKYVDIRWYPRPLSVEAVLPPAR
jgi:hypothetical protein